MNKISNAADLYTLQINESKLTEPVGVSKSLKYIPYSRLNPDKDDTALDEMEQKQEILKKEFDYKDKPLHTVTGYSDKSINNLYNSVSNRRVITFERFLYGLSIRYIGVKIASDIAKCFNSYENLMVYINDPTKGIC